MLAEKVGKSQEAHSSKKPFFPASEKSSIKIIRATISMMPLHLPMPMMQFVWMTMPPAEKWKRHEYLKNMTLSACVVHFIHSSSKMNLHFVWKVPIEDEENEMFGKSYKIRDKLLAEMPVYHTRAMRSEFIHSFGRVNRREKCHSSRGLQTINRR